jgi:peptide/nickel transport system ATP-binding protein/oligopeptide transport system ATP-binding protein
MSALLEIRQLTTQLLTRQGVVTAVDRVSLAVARGKTLALVGESGSGKSMTCASLMRLLPGNGKVVHGEVLFKGEDLLRYSPRQMRAVRAGQIGMVLQDAMTSLNPLLTIGQQLGEVFRYQQGIRDRAQLRRLSIAALDAVHIPAAEARLSSYPFEFSGGMRQRVCIAISIASSPDLLICDEPTTALDVTVQLQILRLLRDLQRERGMAMVFVTHDIELARQFADDVSVMYAGRVVEEGPIDQVFDDPLHPYTRALLQASPRLTEDRQRLMSIPGAPTPLHELGVGCRFAPRCAAASTQCTTSYPDWFRWDTTSRARAAACWQVPLHLSERSRGTGSSDSLENAA